MCIPPFDEEPAMHFALLAKIAARLGIKQLSMGMSGDFVRAIQFGATYVRVGTAIFGARAPADASGVYVSSSSIIRSARRRRLLSSRPRLARSLMAIAGASAERAANWAWLNAKETKSSSAMIDAERGPASRMASSPKTVPGAKVTSRIVAATGLMDIGAGRSFGHNKQVRAAVALVENHSAPLGVLHGLAAAPTRLSRCGSKL